MGAIGSLNAKPPVGDKTLPDFSSAIASANTSVDYNPSEDGGLVSFIEGKLGSVADSGTLIVNSSRFGTVDTAAIQQLLAGTDKAVALRQNNQFSQLITANSVETN